MAALSPSPPFTIHILGASSFFFGQDIKPLNFPGGSVVEKVPANARDMGSVPGSGKSPWRRKWQPTPVFLPGEYHAQRSLAGYSPWGHKRVEYDLNNNNGNNNKLCISISHVTSNSLQVWFAFLLVQHCLFCVQQYLIHISVYIFSINE